MLLAARQVGDAGGYRLGLLVQVAEVQVEQVNRLAVLDGETSRAVSLFHELRFRVRCEKGSESTSRDAWHSRR